MRELNSRRNASDCAMDGVLMGWIVVDGLTDGEMVGVVTDGEMVGVVADGEMVDVVADGNMVGVVADGDMADEVPPDSPLPHFDLHSRDHFTSSTRCNTKDSLSTQRSRGCGSPLLQGRRQRQTETMSPFSFSCLQKHQPISPLSVNGSASFTDPMPRCSREQHSSTVSRSASSSFRTESITRRIAFSACFCSVSSRSCDAAWMRRRSVHRRTTPRFHDPRMSTV